MQPQPQYPQQYPQQYPTLPPNYAQPSAPPAAPYPGAYTQPTQPYGTQAAVAASLAAPQMPGGDQFGGPARVINVIRPRIMDIGPGRLLLIKPTKIERDQKNDLSDDPNAKQDRLTADVVVLDGPPFPYGGKPEQGTPHTHTAQPPQEWPGLWLTQDLIVRQCERSIGGMVLGRLVQGQASKPGRRAPWRLDDPTEADKVIARNYLAGAAVAAATPPAPVPPPAPQAPPVTQQQAAPAPVWNPQTGAWEFPGPTLAGQPNPIPAVPAHPSYPGAQAAAQQYIGAPDAGAQYAPMPPSAPPAPVLDIDTPPQGMDPAIWAQMPAEHRTAIAQSAAGRAHWQ